MTRFSTPMLCLLLCLFLGLPLAAGAQVRLLTLDPAADTVRLQNMGSSTVNVGSYWFCNNGAYDQISSLTATNGSTSLAAGEAVTLSNFSSISLGSSGELGFYNTNSFGSTSAMEDYVQWGSSGFLRESVAVSKGIWTAGVAVSYSGPPDPLMFSGGASDFGPSFWAQVAAFSCVGMSATATSTDETCANCSDGTATAMAPPESTQLLFSENFEDAIDSLTLNTADQGATAGTGGNNQWVVNNFLNCGGFVGQTVNNQPGSITNPANNNGTGGRLLHVASDVIPSFTDREGACFQAGSSELHFAHTSMIDATGFRDVTLSFYYALADAGAGEVFLSTDGGSSWSSLGTLGSTGTSWSQTSFSDPAMEDASFMIGFRFNETSASNDPPLAVDEIRVMGTTGAVAPLSYTWTTGDTTDSISGLAPGSYGVIVTDANGCSDTDSVSVQAHPCTGFSVSATATAVSCNGSSDGTASASIIGGNPPVSLSWNTTPPQTDSTITGLAAGDVVLTATDDSGCVVMDTATVSEPAPVSLSLSTTDESCPGCNDGTAAVSATGGTPPFGYQWSNGATADSIGGLPAGVISVTVTDSNGCMATDSGSIGTLTSRAATAAAGFRIFPNPTAGRLRIQRAHAALEADIRLLAADGSLVRSRELPAGQSAIDVHLGELPAGLYLLQVTTGEGRFFRRIVRQ